MDIYAGCIGRYGDLSATRYQGSSLSAQLVGRIRILARLHCALGSCQLATPGFKCHRIDIMHDHSGTKMASLEMGRL